MKWRRRLKKKLIPKTEVKKNGQVFTPTTIVTTILDKIGYKGKKILTRKIIDNSCGTGNFSSDMIGVILKVLITDFLIRMH